jgi:hypothetical protein
LRSDRRGIAHSHQETSAPAHAGAARRALAGFLPRGWAQGVGTPIALVVAGGLVVFGGILLRGEVLFWGTPLLQFVPWRETAVEMVLRGIAPLWNPSLGMGAPLLANYQSALLYPPNWIQMLVGVAWGQGLLVLLHIVWAGVGMAFLARRLGLSELGRTVAALAFSLSGYSIARAGFLSINATLAWLPWLLLASEAMLDRLWSREALRRAMRAILILGLLFGLQWLAGHAQTAWYSLVLVCAWVAWRASRRGWRFLARSGLALIGAGAVGLALASAQLLPTIEYLLNSYRASSVDLDLAFLYSFSPVRIFGLLLPDVMGDPSRGTYHGYGNFWEDAIYVGALPILLALSAGVRTIRHKGASTRLGVFLLAVSGVSFVFALGVHTPVFPWLFDHIPTFSLFQAPTRWSLLAVFCLSLLAGLGAHQWSPPKARTLYWVRLGTAGAGTMVLTAILARPAFEGGASVLVSSFTRTGIMITVSGILALTYERIQAGRPRAWIWMVGTFVMLDLALAGRGLNPATSGDLYQGSSELLREVGRQHRVYMPAGVEYDLKFGTFFRFDSFSPGLDWRQIRDFGIPNVTSLDGIPSANNFDPILSDRYARWMAELEHKEGAELERLLALMDVGHYAAGDGSTLLRYLPVSDAKRVRLVTQAVAEAGPEAALARVMEPEFDPDRQIVLEAAEVDDAIAQATGGAQEVELRDRTPLSIIVSLASDGGGWLVLSDTWFPGWKSFVDGKPARLLHADYLFRAVHVPPGRHVVEFNYAPWVQAAGALISLAAWLALGGALWRL